jgi:hypothetical protein
VAALSNVWTARIHAWCVSTTSRTIRLTSGNMRFACSTVNVRVPAAGVWLGNGE